MSELRVMALPGLRRPRGVQKRLTLFLNQVMARERGSLRINVVLVDDEYMAGLNQRFRSRQGPTDVLAFPDPDEAEIYLSVQEAARRGEASEEIARLALHGLLHLLGYDHHEPQDAALMQRKEREYMDLWV